MNEVVGYLFRGFFYCPTCIEKVGPPQAPMPVRVFPDNIGIYSQVCSTCRTLIVKGATSDINGVMKPVSLFPLAPPVTFDHRVWSLRSDQAFNDAEKQSTNDRDMIKDLLRHLIAGTVADVEESARGVLYILTNGRERYYS